jgi:hypothetical protein
MEKRNQELYKIKLKYCIWYILQLCSGELSHRDLQCLARREMADGHNFGGTSKFHFNPNSYSCTLMQKYIFTWVKTKNEEK